MTEEEDADVKELSIEFYSFLPLAKQDVLASISQVEAKLELLQNMKDMLNVRTCFSLSLSLFLSLSLSLSLYLSLCVVLIV